MYLRQAVCDVHVLLCLKENKKITTKTDYQKNNVFERTKITQW